MNHDAKRAASVLRIGTRDGAENPDESIHSSKINGKEKQLILSHLL